jgi:hypothetical protein
MDDLMFGMDPVAPGLHPTGKGAIKKAPDIANPGSLREKLPYIGSWPRT